MTNLIYDHTFMTLQFSQAVLLALKRGSQV
jgi:hypothetical protein